MKGNFKLKVTILLLFLCFCLAKPTSAYAQCEFDFDHYIEKVNNSSLGTIYISLKGDPSSYTFQLYDLVQGKVIEEKVANNLSKGMKTLLFENVPSSTYTIYVRKKNCENHITLGGMGGIVVGK